MSNGINRLIALNPLQQPNIPQQFAAGRLAGMELQEQQGALQDAQTERNIAAQEQRNERRNQALRALAYMGEDFATQNFNIDPQVIDEIKNNPDWKSNVIGYLNKASANRKVQSSDFLSGGGVRLVYTDGATEVRKPTKENEDFIKAAEDYDAALQGIRAGERRAAKSAQELSLEANEQVGKLRSTNSKLREVINLVNQGAGTGPLVSALPSVRAASIRLDHIRNNLGLDVVGSVTFGALSEAELNLALQTAVPTNLQGDDLIKWANEKITAQEKLAAYLEEQALFLGKPGRKVVDWIDYIREKGITPSTPQGQQNDPLGIR